MARLVADGKVAVVFASLQLNPHIKMRDDLPLAEQLEGIQGMSQVVVVLAGLSMTIAAAVNLSYVVEALRSLLLTGDLGRLPNWIR